jgi:hypothetical protein
MPVVTGFVARKYSRTVWFIMAPLESKNVGQFAAFVQ